MTHVIRLTLTSRSSASLLCRIVGLLSQHDQPAPDMQVVTTGTDMTVKMVLRGLSPQSARIVTEKMRSFVGVASVDEAAPVGVAA